MNWTGTGLNSLNRLIIFITLIFFIAPGTGCSGYHQPDDAEEVETLVGSLKLPFDYEIGTDHKIYFLVTGERYPGHFSGWGSHVSGLTGHSEGDGKSNFVVFVSPADKMVEFKDHFYNPGGNNDGICDPGESCGITAESAFAGAPWYRVKHDNTYLTGYIPGYGPTGSDYVAGENPQSIIFLITHDIGFQIGHLGELSPELTELLVERFGDQARSNPSSVDFSSLGIQPLSLPLDLKLARPQLLGTCLADIEGSTLYGIVKAQVEFFISRDENPANTESCYFRYFSSSDQVLFQKAIDAYFVNPGEWGPYFHFYDNGITFNHTRGGEGKLCNTERFNIMNYDTIESEGGYGWIGEPMSKKEIFSIYRIHRDTVAYSLSAGEFDPDADFLFTRESTGGVFTLTDGSRTYSVIGVTGEVLDMDDPGAGSGTFILKMSGNFFLQYESGDPSITEEAFKSTPYLGVRYRLDQDKLILRFGNLQETRDAVVFPESIPPGAVSCDGINYHCYNHNWYALNQAKNR